MSVIERIKSLIPQALLVKLHFLKKGFYTSRFYRRIFIQPRVARIRKKKTIHVLFIAISPALWKVDSLYKSMMNHPRFKVSLLVSPNMTHRDISLRESDYQRLKEFFDKKEYLYEEWCDIHGQSLYKRIPDPYDIIIYPQPYGGIIPKALDYPRNMHKLLIGCEYAFHSGSQKWAYNKDYQNIAWIDCYENESVCQYSRKIKHNKGINSQVTGLPFVDEYIKNGHPSPWKLQDTPCKKIIWATHWTIQAQDAAHLNYSNFLEIADYMLQFAQSQMGKLQFTFKPHPWLKRELYNHPEWGKIRTDSYYAAWEHGDNTQLEQGEYVDLFMTSDAMIHDCSSFCCEYLLTGKPVFFMARNEEKQVSMLNEMAHSAFYAQYIGHKMEDLQQFLHHQILNGCDSMKEQREEVVRKYFTPPHNKSAAENIISAILGKDA